MIDNLALYDTVGQTWSAIGGGTDGEVLAIERQPNGGLVIAGTFTQVNGVAADGLAVWDGTSWSGLPGATGTVKALGYDSSGNLIAGGLFSAIGGVAALNVALWNGSSWSAMGAGLSTSGSIFGSPGVNDLDVLTNGTLVAAGALIDRVATWDGTNWTALPTPPGLAAQLTDLAPEPSGTLLCAGLVFGESAVLRWDGTSWSQLGNLDLGVDDVDLLPNGDIVVCGDQLSRGVFRWDGTGWEALGTFGVFSGSTHAIEAFPGSQPGQFFVGGDLPRIGSAYGNSLFFYDGNAMVGDAVAANGSVTDMVAFPNGETYVVGSFTQIGGANAPSIARWGASWESVGSGLPVAGGAVDKLANGDLVVPTSQGVYRFDGSTWQLMPGSPGTSYPTLLLRPNGDLLVGEQLALWRYDGSTWMQIQGVANVVDMENLANGNVAMTCGPNGLPIASGRIAEWDGGSNWIALDPSSSIINPRDLAVMKNGQLAVADDSQVGVRVLSGTTWSQLGALNGKALCLELNAAKELVAGGSFTADGGVPCVHVARWTGTGWSDIAGGSPAPPINIAPAANGDVLSRITTGLSDVKISWHRTACPASAVSYSPACAGAAGISELTVSRLPLVGGNYEARATGLSNNAIVFDLYGQQAVNLPLANWVQLALPGCVLAVDPVEVRMQAAQSTLTSSFAIPSQQSLAGIDIRHQMLLLDVGSQGNLLASSTTNAVHFTLGSL